MRAAAVSLALLYACAAVAQERPSSAPPQSRSFPRPPSASNAAGPASAPGRVKTAYIRELSVDIPFSIQRDAARSEKLEVYLFVSQDRGGRWQLYSKKPATDPRFQFRAPRDGEYWLATKTVETDGAPNYEEPTRPDMRLIVDTKQPQLALEVKSNGAGELIASFRVRDENLDPTTARLECQVRGSTVWTQVPLEKQLKRESPIQASGTVVWRLDAPSGALVRMEVVDLAENRVSATREVAWTESPSTPALPADVARRGARGPLTGNGAPGTAAGTVWNQPSQRSADRSPRRGVPIDGVPPQAGPETRTTKRLSTPPTGISPDGATAEGTPWPADNTRQEGSANLIVGERPGPATSDVANQPANTESEEISAVSQSTTPNSKIKPDPRHDELAHNSRDVPFPFNAEELPAPPARGAGKSAGQVNSSRGAANQPGPRQPGSGDQGVPLVRGATRSPPDARVNSKIPFRRISAPADEGPGDLTSSSAANEELPPGPEQQDAPLTLPPGEQPRMTSERRFMLEYDIEAAGPGGVKAVELWGTSDGGRVWRRWANDPDRESPLEAEVERDGIYGFKIVIVSNVGLSSPPPKANDPADLWVGVDTTRPVARLTSARYGRGSSAGELILTWQAQDSHLAERPITLLFSQNVDGPWTTIAAGLRNSGQYAWAADPNLPREIYLRLEVRDEAGNVGVDLLTEPIRVEGLAPKGRIKGFRSSASGSP